jgi:hypothetical protein
MFDHLYFPPLEKRQRSTKRSGLDLWITKLLSFVSLIETFWRRGLGNGINPLRLAPEPVVNNLFDLPDCHIVEPAQSGTFGWSCLAQSSVELLLDFSSP